MRYRLSLRTNGALWYQTWHFWVSGWFPPFESKNKEKQWLQMLQAGCTSSATSSAVNWEEKVIGAVSRSSFWDSANFSAICLGLLMEARMELMSSLVSLSGDLWKWCSSSGTTHGLANLDGSLSGGQVLDASCFYDPSNVESMWEDCLGCLGLVVWYCFCHSPW